MKRVTEITGLNTKDLSQVIQGLETLLATYQVYYTNLRGYHWHIRGAEFMPLHQQFEKMYDDMAEKIDEVAERILQLGASPENRFSVLLGQSKISEKTECTTPNEILGNIMDSYTIMIALEREIIKAAGDVEDETTVALIGEFLAGQEKEAWILDAMVNK